MSTLQPFSVILTYVEVLQAYEPVVADHILKLGLTMLASWEKEAPDEASRESLLTVVPSHRALLAYADQKS